MALPLDPGERDRLVTIQSLTEGVGTSGFPTETWTDLATAWMSKADLSGSEPYVANQFSAAAVIVFELPYRADMDPEAIDVAKVRQLVYGGRVYDITRAEMRGRRDGIRLYCLAKVG